MYTYLIRTTLYKHSFCFQDSQIDRCFSRKENIEYTSLFNYTKESQCSFIRPQMEEIN